MKIESLKNERVKNWIKLHQKKYRDETNLFLIEEDHLINEALKKGIVNTIIICDDSKDIFNFENTVIVNRSVMNKISTNVSNVRYIAVCNKLKENFVLSNRILILDQIQDPKNMGTLIRSALSFGFNQIILSENCVDLYNDKTLRGAQGSLFHINFIKDDLINKISYLKENNYKVIALTLNNSIYLNDLKKHKNMAFVLGNEGNGIRKEVEDICDERVKIEMKSFDSLNVSIAGSIAMYVFNNV